MAIKLYQFTDCPYCEKVRQALADLNLEYEKIEVDYDREKRPEIVKTRNNYKVPVLDDDGEIVVDSDVIVEYLRKKYGKN